MLSTARFVNDEKPEIYTTNDADFATMSSAVRNGMLCLNRIPGALTGATKQELKKRLTTCN